MDQKWLIPDRLCSLADDTVRIEIGPQVIELDCTDENLADTVTHRSYKPGKRDAMGRLIRPDEAGVKPELIATDLSRGLVPIKAGEKMHCVDHKAIHVPHLWKVYQLQETDEPIFEMGRMVLDDGGAPVKRSRFIKVDEREGFDEALAVAEGLVA